MKPRAITFCKLCGKARLSLKHGLCAKCLRVCEQFPDDATLTLDGLNRLLDDLDRPDK